ncbi:hypothetical protein ACGLWX_09525 [Halomonas sp. HMF6819]|uniref:hypothetical protein n=1 Tax=Halomonas sp. HMF6819 TaxID=3373085 RepID=UPI0037955831
MSDDTENNAIVRDSSEFDLTGGEFATFLHEKCQGMKCPACGSEEVPMFEADSFDGPVHLSSSPILSPEGYGAKGHCTAICQSCGYTWVFAAGFIFDWALEKRMEDSHSEE